MRERERQDDIFSASPKERVLGPRWLAATERGAEHARKSPWVLHPMELGDLRRGAASFQGLPTGLQTAVLGSHLLLHTAHTPESHNASNIPPGQYNPGKSILESPRAKEGGRQRDLTSNVMNTYLCTVRSL